LLLAGFAVIFDLIHQIDLMQMELENSIEGLLTAPPEVLKLAGHPIRVEGSEEERLVAFRHIRDLIATRINQFLGHHL